MTARPGRVAAELTIAAAWPRNDDWRVSNAFSAEARRVSDQLKETLDVDHIDH